jgi:hypothetical protein
VKVEKAQVGALAEVLKNASLQGHIVTFRRFGDRDARIQVVEHHPRYWKRGPASKRVRRVTTIGARGGLTIVEGS